FFFFQAEDGIRDSSVTGVQTCALPISKHREVIGYTNDLDPATYHIVSTVAGAEAVDWSQYERIKIFYQTTLNADDFNDVVATIRSEERRVGKECISGMLWDQ